MVINFSTINFLGIKQPAKATINRPIQNNIKSLISDSVSFKGIESEDCLDTPEKRAAFLTICINDWVKPSIGSKLAKLISTRGKYSLEQVKHRKEYHTFEGFETTLKINSGKTENRSDNPKQIAEQLLSGDATWKDIGRFSKFDKNTYIAKQSKITILPDGREAIISIGPNHIIDKEYANGFICMMKEDPSGKLRAELRVPCELKTNEPENPAMKLAKKEFDTDNIFNVTFITPCCGSTTDPENPVYKLAAKVFNL
ncbi:MAG: hypothetical protein AB1782_05515 [Cyanobacteriota bacterium]